MNLVIILSALMLGVASGGHCIAMCGAGSAWGIGLSGDQVSSSRERLRRLLSFQLGRVIAYGLVGAVLGGAAAAFHALTEWVSILRPVWTMANTAFFLFGATLLITARQPRVLDAVGQRFGQWFRSASSRNAQPLAFYPRAGGAVPMRPAKRGLAVGLSWAFIPCGPLYSAWTLTLFSGDALSGAMTGAAFALASGVQLGLAQWWFGQRAQTNSSKPQGGRWDKLGIRVAGAALCLSAGYSLFMMISGAKSDGLFCL